MGTRRAQHTHQPRRAPAATVVFSPLLPGPYEHSTILYDGSMTTRERVTISVPESVLDRARAAVASGTAASVSAYITTALERMATQDSMAELLAEMAKVGGEPTEADYAWAREALGYS